MVEGFFGIIKAYASDIIMGIIILLVGFGIGILVKRILQRVLKEVGLNKIMRRGNIGTDLERWVSSIVSYVIYLVTLVIFLDQLGLKSVVLYLVVGAVLMLIILTSLVGLKDVIPNFVAWVIIQKRGNIQEDRWIDIKEISGYVLKIGYLETEIKTDKGDILYVPNSLFLKSKFKLRKD